MNAQREDGSDFDTAMNSAWGEGNGETDQTPMEPIIFDEDGIPNLGDYVFGKDVFSIMGT
jgi:hypothetical protein